MVLMPPGAAPIDDIGYIHTYVHTYIWIYCVVAQVADELAEDVQDPDMLSQIYLRTPNGHKSLRTFAF